MRSEIIIQFEVLLGSVGVILSLFFGVFLILTFRKRPRANIFLGLYLIALGLRIGKALFFSFYPIDPQIRNIFLALLLSVGPSCWFYVRYFLTPKKSIKIEQWLYHYLPFGLFITFFWLIPNDGQFLALLVFTGLLLHMSIYAFISFGWVLSNKNELSQSKGEKKAEVQWALFFSGATIVMIACFTASFIYVIPYLSSVFVFSGGIVILAIWALSNPSLFEMQYKKYANSQLSEKRAKYYINELNKLMHSEEPFLDSELSLGKLSDLLGISSKQLSQVINQIKNENYSQFITRHRIEKAKELLSSPSFQQEKIATIAYECGFNSISSFNTYFKELQGETASQYRKRQLSISTD